MKTEILIFLDYDGVLHPDAVYRRLNGLGTRIGVSSRISLFA